MRYIPNNRSILKLRKLTMAAVESKETNKKASERIEEVSRMK